MLFIQKVDKAKNFFCQFAAFLESDITVKKYISDIDWVCSRR